MSKPSKNKFFHIGNDGVVTTLVSADDIDEAQQDAARMGLVGTVMTDVEYDASPEKAAQTLARARDMKRAMIEVTIPPLVDALLFIDDSALTTEGRARKAIAQYAMLKQDELNQMTQAEVDAYDPASDPQLQV